LQGLPQRIVDQGIENDTRIGLDSNDDPVQLAMRSNHAPNVLDRLGLVELHEARTRYRMDRIAGRVGYEVKVKSRQHRFNSFACAQSSPKTRHFHRRRQKRPTVPTTS
jgi:hypothetical protein